MGTVSKLPGKKGTSGERLSPEDRFVQEFIVDRDPIAAALRAGVASINVERKALQWMKNPSIQRKIMDATNTQDVTKMITPQRIMAGWLDILNDPTAPASAKHSILKELAIINGLYPEKEGDKGKNPAGRNIMIVPGDVALSDWEKAAREQQQELKDNVRK